MALAHGETVGTRRLERAVSAFCVEKYSGKDGEKRMARLKWLDEYCNNAGTSSTAGTPGCQRRLHTDSPAVSPA